MKRYEHHIVLWAGNAYSMEDYCGVRQEEILPLIRPVI